LVASPVPPCLFILHRQTETDEADGVTEMACRLVVVSDGDSDLGFPAGFSGAGLRILKDGLGNKSCTM
jgi:hypothetical protein